MPDGWRWAQIGQLYEVIGGGTPSTKVSEYWEGDIPWISSADIDDAHNIKPRRYITRDAIDDSATNLVPAGSIIVVTRVGLGKVALAKEQLCFSQDSQGLIERKGFVKPEYALHYLSQATQEFKYKSRGTTIVGVTKKQLKELQFPLAPLPEQERIVAEIEKQFTRLDQAVASLRRLQGNLARYKASVLKAACDGRLVPQDPGDEPAAALLARILAERRAQWQAANPGKKYKEAAGVDTAVVPDLPEGWVWARVDQLSEVRLGRQRSPKNHRGAHMHPYLRAANATWDGVDLSDVMEMNFRPIELEIYRLKKGDILLSEASGSANEVGKPFIWKEQIQDCCFQNTLIRVRLLNMSPDYLHLHFFTDALTGRFGRIAKGVGIHHLGANRLAEMPVAIPPLAEQERIVAEVERRLSVITVTEQAITANLARAERLRQCILHRAFTGRLVTNTGL